MGKTFKIILFSLGFLLFAGIIYWQFVKKAVIKNKIEQAVAKGTGNDYYIKYDSSYIDEVGGNASFYNIVLQSDSMQKKMLENDTSVDATIFNVQVKQLDITGLNVPGFLQKSSLEATKIRIIKPVITLINTGKKKKPMSKEDSLALYQRITGKFDNIEAKEIEIVDAVIAFANGNSSPHTTVQDVNLVLQNLKIDKEHNYDDLVSYFVKDLVITAKSINSVNEETRQKFVVEGIKYSAPGRQLTIAKILQGPQNSGNNTLNISEVLLTGINTNEFVYSNKIQADSLQVGGGDITVKNNNSASGKKMKLDFDNDFFNSAQVKNIFLRKSSIHIIKAGNPEETLIKNIAFSAEQLGTVSETTDLQEWLAGSNWKISGDGTTLSSKDGIYDMVIGAFDMEKKTGVMHLKEFRLKPRISWPDYVKQLKVQKDLYDFAFSNITAKDLNTSRLVSDNEFIAGELIVTPKMRIFNDRTIPFDKSSKVGLYPQQQLMAMDFPINIRKLDIRNGAVIYRERGNLSKKTGDVIFTNINGTVTNITNMQTAVNQNPDMILKASATFLGVAKLYTTWNLPLNKGNARFKVSGSIGSFDAKKLNVITEPLGMATISQGRINGLEYSMTGNDFHTDGSATLKYENLKIKLLKSSGDSTADLERKSLISFAANLFVKNSNPRNGDLRSGKIDFDRDVTKSFFNLLWKSIFQASKRIAKGKDDE